jgi:hypothetical protein|tara:strand:- start:1055 stop:1486 length:432 start_codon:yes stop_codon:yes gene_type:complete
MTKLCARGKAAAKRKFKVYPSAYANAYASKICAGKIKDPSGVKRKDFKGPKPASAKDGKFFMNEIEKERDVRKGKKNVKQKVEGLSIRKELAKKKFPYKGPNISPEDFNVGGHAVMGSPVSVDVDGDNLSNPSASDYYKDLLK